MYEEFFGLEVKPFELVPNPEFFYLSRSHKKALNFLEYGLYERAGFILLTGEVGSGKTSILRNIIRDMNSDVALSMLFNTRVSNKQVLSMINEDFGLNVTSKDKITLLRNLNDFLVGIHSEQRRAVVIIDEAQNLSISALEEIRMLSNLEAADSKLLQIILVGQPELEKTIAREELRQLRQRISVYCRIAPLTLKETEDYVYHRLQKAGNRNALTWGEGTFEALFRLSSGIPRVVNVFCDFILLAAYVENRTELDVEFVEEVIWDVSWDKHISENVEEQAAYNPITASRQKLVERLSAYEERIATLEGLQEQQKEISREFQEQKDLLLKLLEAQENGFSRIETSLDRAFDQKHGIQKKPEQKEDEGVDALEHDEAGGPDNRDDFEKPEIQQNKGFFGKLFS